MKQRVLLNGVFSEDVEVLSSVPQGLVLGPCPFLLYTNDLHELLSSNVRLFADDTIAYLTTDSELESCPIQNDLEKQKLIGSKFGINARSSEVAETSACPA